MDGVRRRDAEPSRPSERELRKQWDQHRVELALDGVDVAAISAAQEPEPTGRTDAELRVQAKALGLPVAPPRKGTRDSFRDDMFDLLMGR